jgi:hypothetical protein
MLENDVTTPSDDPNRDLYCLECGYNLRGLSGDPRRCPECGYQNPLSDLTLPADAIAEQLRELETAPTNCLAVILLAGLCFVLLVGVLFVFRDEQDSVSPGVLVALVGLMVIAVVAKLAWSASAESFRESCQDNPAWKAALRRYHYLGLSVVAPSGAAIMAVGLLGRRASFSWMLAIIFLLAVAMLLVGRWARRELKLIIDPLQRESAVRIAHKTLAWKMKRTW